MLSSTPSIIADGPTSNERQRLLERDAPSSPGLLPADWSNQEKIRRLGLFIEVTGFIAPPDQYISQYRPPQDAPYGIWGGLAQGLAQGAESYSVGMSRNDIASVNKRNYLVREAIKAYRFTDYDRAVSLINAAVMIDNERNHGDSALF